MFQSGITANYEIDLGYEYWLIIIIEICIYKPVFKILFYIRNTFFHLENLFLIIL